MITRRRHCVHEFISISVRKTQNSSFVTIHPSANLRTASPYLTPLCKRAILASGRHRHELLHHARNAPAAPCQSVSAAARRRRVCRAGAKPGDGSAVYLARRNPTESCAVAELGVTVLGVPVGESIGSAVSATALLRPPS